MILAASFRARGLRVQAYKAGPDYLDPTQLAWASGRPTFNLDTFFLDETALQTRLGTLSDEADVVLVEGVMGLFDGRDSLGKSASSAQLAKVLALPVILVIDASAMAGSIAAIAQGFRQFDPDLNVCGVIANRVGSDRHAAILVEALAAVDIPLLGAIPRDSRLELPSRHLGLHQANETRLPLELLEELGLSLELDDILSIACNAPDLLLPSLPPVTQVDPQIYPHVQIGVAKDEAFCFYYPENLDALTQAGADLCFFSPLHDPELPDGLGGIYLGGGYPELYADALSKNETMLASIRTFGGVIYAECGGRMILAEALECDAQSYPMAGVIPGSAHFSRTAKVKLGYRELRATRDSPVVVAGTRVKGHEFHYSTHDTAAETLFESLTGPYHEGYAAGQVHASYVHLYFPASPDVAKRFVESAGRSVQNGRLRQGESV